ncbi:MAG: hypothetical protein ACW990_10025 [Promethearchaeota archaeon]
MDEQKDEEFDEDGFDPTKDAFFSDLIGIEEEIASEAYELVAHALTNRSFTSGYRNVYSN